MRHDLKRYLVTYRQLLQEGKYEVIEADIDKILGKRLNTNHCVYTENTILNAVICEKMEQCSIKNIKIEVQVNADKDMDSIEYGVVLSNLLDNAIEAEEQEKEENRYICLNIGEEQNMIREAIVKLVNKENLTYEMAEGAMDEIMGGKADPIQISAFLTAMTMKGETIEEITACANGMRKHGIHMEHDKDVLEIVGTGGDKSNSFNISTTASLVISAGGVAVAKHGNRAASSKSGAADCLEALGVKVDLEPEKNKEVLEKLGICFLFAQKYHMSMKYVAPVRKMLGIRTIFNILGPLTNPAAATMQVMGVYEEALVRPMAEVLSNLGVKRGMVVYGQDCLDEISLSAPTSVCEIKDGTFEEYVITPEEFGMTRCTKEELVGGTPQENAEITKEILAGKKGPARDAVVLNAAAALHVAKEIPMQDAVKLAEELIDSGKAQKKLEEFVSLTNKLAEKE